MSSSDFKKECLDGVNGHYKKIHVVKVNNILVAISIICYEG